MEFKNKVYLRNNSDNRKILTLKIKARINKSYKYNYSINLALKILITISQINLPLLNQVFSVTQINNSNKHSQLIDN